MSNSIIEPPEPSAAGNKPQRLYFKTYLAMIDHAPGTKMFRSFYLQEPSGTEYDAIDDGSKACAFFVSSVLTIFHKIQDIHGTVNATIKDLEGSGWQPVTEFEPGDVLVWEATSKSDGHRHIGFAIGGDRAVSTSTVSRQVVQHQLHFGAEHRVITHAYRGNW